MSTSRGERGPRGDHGQTGDTGDTGDVGVTGPAGATGTPGNPGNTGNQGIQGPQGEQGPRGLPLSRWTQLVVYVGIVIAFLGALKLANDASDRSQKVSETNQLQVLTDCVRNNIDAARVVAAIDFKPPGATDAQNDARPLIAKNLYPIFDCKQTQTRGYGVRLSPVESAKYVAIVTLKGRAPIVNKGKVIGSRESLLARVKTFDDAGKLP